MNLLGMLLKVMTAKSAVKQIARKTGLSEKQVKRLMTIAIPILLKYLTKNASSGDGVSSFWARCRRIPNKKKPICSSRKRMKRTAARLSATSLAKKRRKLRRTCPHSPDCLQSRLTRSLAIMAPALMSGVSKRLPEAQLPCNPLYSTQYPGIFSALLGTAPQTQAATKEEKDDAINGTALLQALLNARK